MLKEITHFFAVYKDLEGKRVEVNGWHDADYARERVLVAARNFEESSSPKTVPSLT
jgi:inorganic pyrophosphatase